MTKHQDPGVLSMTWLSRLVPQGCGLQRLADLNHRTRQGKRRRRMANLELLEDRTLLSGNVLVYPVVPPGSPNAGQLVIQLDNFSDHVNINENGGNSVSVSGLGNTSVNGQGPGTSVTRNEVLSIVVDIAGTFSNFPVISLTEQLTDGFTSSGIKNVEFDVTGVAAGNAPNVALTVTGVVNTGTFTLNENNGGGLNVTVGNSQFAALTIDQTGCCQAIVDLESDRIVDAVSVSEGVAAGDQILVDQNTTGMSNFGSTTFTQGAGPAVIGATPPCDGTGDSVLVDDANFKDLTINQTLQQIPTDSSGSPLLSEGGSEQILVGLKSPVKVALTNSGIAATQ